MDFRKIFIFISLLFFLSCGSDNFINYQQDLTKECVDYCYSQNAVNVLVFQDDPSFYDLTEPICTCIFGGDEE